MLLLVWCLTIWGHDILRGSKGTHQIVWLLLALPILFVSHRSSMLALAVYQQDQWGFPSRISLLKCFHVAVNKECPSRNWSVLSLSGSPQHNPAIFLCLWYRQHWIDWGNIWNDSFVIFVVVIRDYPNDMASKFAVHQTLFWFCIYVHPYLSHWAIFNHDLLLVDFFFGVEILHLDMLCLFCATCFTICFQQDYTHIVLI